MSLKILILALCLTACVALANLPNIIRPCQLRDHKCIQNNLRPNSRCNRRVRGSAPPVLNVPTTRFETPAFNSSYVENGLIIRGLDRCYVSEFYINRLTNGGVVALDCPWLNFESNRIMYQHFSLREDAVFRYKINGSYPLIRLTTSLPKFDQLDLCKQFTFADVTALPVFDISPEDRATQHYLTRDLTALNIYERETFLYRANLLSRTVINSIICDFGCNN